MLTIEEIRGVVTAFADAAERAYRARFDFVEVHAGHGYLITNFLSPFTNDRADAYGGSAENRARILIEIVDEIRGRVPRDFPLSVRISATDYEPGGIEIGETVELCQRLERHGVDVIHVSGGHHARMEWEVSAWDMPRQPHRWAWEKIKSAVGVPIIASGSLVTPEIAEEILASGSADLVSLGRAMLADPSWAEKAKAGRTLQIVPCIRCNDGCLYRGLDAGRSTGCTVNRSMAEEGRFPLTPAAVPRDLAVVGGGPAGLKAAAVLHDRGHRVTLYEPAELGGLLTHADGATVRQDLAGLRRHLVHEVERRGITVVPSAASSRSLAAAGHDGAVVATGAAHRGFDGTVDPGAVVRRAHEIRPADVTGKRVVIVGGGFQGCETALRLAKANGAEVTVLERGERLLAGDEVIYDVMHLPSRLDEEGVTARTGAEVVEIGTDGVILACGDRVAADLVVLALGREPAPTTLRDELVTAGIEASVVGSARRPGRVYDAIHTASFAARLL